MSINNNNEDDANIFWLTKVDLISLYFTVESQQLSLFLYFSQILVLSYLDSWSNIQTKLITDLHFLTVVLLWL